MLAKLRTGLAGERTGLAGARVGWQKQEWGWFFFLMPTREGRAMSEGNSSE